MIDPRATTSHLAHATRGRHRLFRPSLFLGAGCLWLLAACEDVPTGSYEDPPQAPGATGDVQISLDCFVDAAEERFSCRPSSPASAVSLSKGVQAGNAGGVQADVIAGSQDRLMRLTSANTSTSGGVLSADVTVQNLLLQPLATQDGTTLDPEGVRVFFFTGPTNGVDVANPDGTATFTSADQPYFEYDELLQPAQTSSSKSWQFTLNGAPTFNFSVLVSAEVPDENAIAFSAIKITHGGSHSCAISSPDGAPFGPAFCWGSNESGQLGDGTTTTRVTPTAVAGGVRFWAIAAGQEHTCGVDGLGTAYCWGDNFAGQLGDSTTTQRLTPTAVVAGELQFDTIIAAGFFHTCSKVRLGGDVHCWGSNAFGQLGDGTLTERHTPTAVAGGVTFSEIITAAGSHTCGLDEMRNAYCWGNNAAGELGDSTQTNRLTPTAVAGGLTFSAIQAGSAHTCGLDTGGAAYCWGSNAQGQIGDGGILFGARVTPTAVATELTFSAIKAYGNNSCGLDPAGSAYCWGDNSSGQIGDGTTTLRSTPVAVVGGLTFASLDEGEGNYTCGLTSAGIGYCWGRNGNGQLGDGTTDTRHVPGFIASTR